MGIGGEEQDINFANNGVAVDSKGSSLTKDNLMAADKVLTFMLDMLRPGMLSKEVWETLYAKVRYLRIEIRFIYAAP